MPNLIKKFKHDNTKNSQNLQHVAVLRRITMTDKCTTEKIWYCDRSG